MHLISSFSINSEITLSVSSLEGSSCGQGQTVIWQNRPHPPIQQQTDFLGYANHFHFLDQK
jgi:hypothetical protein